MTNREDHLEFAISAIEKTRKDVGMVVFSDEQTTWIAAVSEGAVVAFEQYDFGGDAVTAYLAGTLQKRGLRLTIDADKAVVDKIKQQLCYVALDFANELDSSKVVSSREINYEMDDGSVVTIGKERFSAPETVFRPSLRGSGSPGLHEAAFKIFQQCDEGLWKYLLPNIVLAGSNLLFNGLRERFELEIKRLLPQALTRFVKTHDIKRFEDDYE